MSVLIFSLHNYYRTVSKQSTIEEELFGNLGKK